MNRTLKLAGDWAPGPLPVDTFPWSGLLLYNLEGPVLDSNKQECLKAPKAGPSLANASLPQLQGPTVAVLANNHMMDFGRPGLEYSITSLDQLNTPHVGAGFTRELAIAPLQIEWNGLKIGIVARCESQFGVATEGGPGVAAFGFSIYRQIAQLKRECDVVIVSIHEAAEMFAWPSPKRQEKFRSLIEAGASIVYGHHSHVPQGWEKYEHGLIFYGLGNFCVDPDAWSGYQNTLWSLAPEIAWRDGNMNFQPTTLTIEDHNELIVVRGASELEKGEHATYLDCCNRPLTNPGLLAGLWQEVSVQMYQSYYARWLGFESKEVGTVRRGIRRAIAKTGVTNLLGRGAVADDAHRDAYLLRHHLFVCESHSDAIATALGVLGGELEDVRSEETARLCREMVSL
ncbi:MAG: CapA family protein [Halioglobus sp.]